MVKAVTKPAAEKPPSGGSVQVNLVEESNVEVAKEPVVVEFTRTERRRPPRTCVFVTLLLLVLLVGFLVVYSIEKSNRDKNRSMQWKYGEDGIKITDPPRVLNNSESSSTFWCGTDDVSWETQEEFYTLSDAISQDDIMGLRPIFRKDLPHNYVAYWEAKINGKTGEKYVIISAARQTGDHRLAEEGSLPSPSDLLTAQANSHGYGCHRVYRLRPDGLMACEDTDVNKMVAITRNIDTDSTDIDWRHLDKQVTRELPNMEREWKEQAERLKKTPEWNRFEWLSMAVGDVSTKPTTLVEPITTSPTQESSVNLETEYNFEVEETEDGFKAELGLQPGDSVRIPLGEGFRDVRVKFVGLRDGDWIKAKSGKKRWQKRLCRVLSDLCDSDGNVDISMVSKRFFKLTKTGDRFIKVKVDADENFVRRNLGGREIRFKVELRTRGTQTMVINYGIILKNRRHRRAFSNKHFGIPHEELLPKYRQHHHGQCTTGSGPVAWAKILGYFNNMAARTYNSSYPPLNNMLDWPAHLPLTMDTSVENMTQRIFSELGSHCSHHGGGVTSPAHMGRIKKAFEKVPGRELKVIHRGYHGGKAGSWKNLIIDLLKKGYPVIVSKDNSKHGQHHYVVVTRIRQSARYYSFCRRQTGECSPWTLKEESLMFVHEEDAPGKWEPADIRFMAAIFER